MSVEVIRKEHLTKKEINQMWRRFIFHYNGCSNMENWFGYGWAYSLAPFFQKYYNKEGQVEGLLRHGDFYNTEQQLGALIHGIVLSLEEEKAIRGDVSDEMIRATKASLMGPIAGVGDSLIQGTLIPVLMSIACSLTTNSGVLGPIFYIISFNLIITLMTYTLFHQGYRFGRTAISSITSSTVSKVTEAFSLFGVIVIGSLGASYVVPTTTLSFTAASADGTSTTMIQSIINSIYPNLLGLGLILICYWLCKYKKASVIKLVFGMMLVVIILAYLHII